MSVMETGGLLSFSQEPYIRDTGII